MWYHINSRWGQVEGPPLSILKYIVRTLEEMFQYETIDDHAKRRKLLCLPHSGMKVYVELWYESNFTYSIEIKEVIK